MSVVNTETVVMMGAALAAATCRDRKPSEPGKEPSGGTRQKMWRRVFRKRRVCGRN